MKGGEKYDMVSIGVVAVVSIICVVLMVINLSPGERTAEPERTTLVGKGASYGDACRPAEGQFDFSSLDFNADGRLDLYDYLDVLAGKIVPGQDVDLDDDGFISEADREAFVRLVVRLYDYDASGDIGRDDQRILAARSIGTGTISPDHVYDLDGDGLVCESDVILFTSLLYNYETGRGAA